MRHTSAHSEGFTKEKQGESSILVGNMNNSFGVIEYQSNILLVKVTFPFLFKIFKTIESEVNSQNAGY